VQITTNHPYLKTQFLNIRQQTETICASLKPEDTAIQPVDYVSPPKWHLAHTTWFFEQFVLVEQCADYNVFHPDFGYYFNSYYNTLGDRVVRADRGLMTRPALNEVLAYRAYVNKHLALFLDKGVSEATARIIEIGLQHEQQHQELLLYDIKYIFGHQPSFPRLEYQIQLLPETVQPHFVKIPEGVYNVGHKGEGFCWDNELGQHKVYLHDFEISNRLVTNSDYIEFINSGGYKDFNLWHADGWDFIQQNKLAAPMYWHKVNDKWMYYTLQGFKALDFSAPVSHVSFYEAFAFAQFKGMRLPTEFEWEVASSQFNYGNVWEWTNSAYLPYPKYAKPDGAIGEYNGKFMVNTMVLRGASVATPNNHSRPTYRNFFNPEMRWQFSGIRLAK
tara:strand:- start:62928 stop:64094 length:1167 start_codon:yes stop_codon:yes gene_type:complete